MYLNLYFRAREIAQMLKALAVLPEAQNSIPSTHTRTYNHLLTLVLGPPMPSPSLCGHCTHMVHRHAYADKILTYIK